MKFRIMSDLHTEFTKFGVGATPEDKDTVLILAGDIGVQGQVAPTLIKFAKRFRDVVHVYGNHEYYGGSFENTGVNIENKLMDLCEQQKIPYFKNITSTQMDSVLFDNVLVIATTLWTDFNNDNPFVRMAARTMNDYDVIDMWGRKLSVNDILEVHKDQLKFIKEQVAVCENNGWTAFVVTHHAPCSMSVHPRYGNTPLNGCYYTDLSEFILDHPVIKTWVHGHTHDSHDYMIGDCRIICNPRGYTEATQPAENPNFNPLLDIDL